MLGGLPAKKVTNKQLSHYTCDMALGTQEVAKLLGVVPRSLQRWIAHGALEHPRMLGGKLQWNGDDINRARKVKMQLRGGALQRLVERVRKLEEKRASKAARSGRSKKRDNERLSVEKLAARLKTKKNSIYQLTRKRAGRPLTDPLPTVRIGREIRFRWHDVVEWFERQAGAED
jgi:excisionase family DNA binding protein